MIIAPVTLYNFAIYTQSRTYAANGISLEVPLIASGVGNMHQHASASSVGTTPAWLWLSTSYTAKGRFNTASRQEE